MHCEDKGILFESEGGMRETRHIFLLKVFLLLLLIFI